MAVFLRRMVTFGESHSSRMIPSRKWAKKVALGCILVENGNSDRMVNVVLEVGQGCLA